MAHNSWTLDKDYADGETLDEADLDAAFDSGTNWSSDVKDNFTQILLDAFPSGYELDNDGAANLTNSLYNKQSASVGFYDSNIELGTIPTVSCTPISASCNLVFTPEATGKYFISYQCCVRTETADGEVDQKICLYDVTNDATLTSAWVRNNTAGGAPSGGTIDITTPITLNHEYNFSSTAAATFSLYQFVTAINSDVNTNYIGANAELYFGVYGQIHKI